LRSIMVMIFFVYTLFIDVELMSLCVIYFRNHRVI